MEFKDFLIKANLDDPSLEDFYIRVTVNGETQVCRIFNLDSYGMRIIFGGDGYFEHDPSVSDFLKTVGPEKLEVPRYNGTDNDIKACLNHTAGGIVVSYSSYEVTVHRLCPTRILFENASGEKEKLQKCSLKNGMSSKIVFSYRDLYNRMLKTEDWVDSSATLIIGTEKVQITLLPIREHAFRKAIQLLKKFSPYIDSSDLKSSTLSLPRRLLPQRNVQDLNPCSNSAFEENKDEPSSSDPPLPENESNSVGKFHSLSMPRLRRRLRHSDDVL